MAVLILGSGSMRALRVYVVGSLAANALPRTKGISVTPRVTAPTEEKEEEVERASFVSPLFLGVAKQAGLYREVQVLKSTLVAMARI